MLRNIPADHFLEADGVKPTRPGIRGPPNQVFSDRLREVIGCSACVAPALEDSCLWIRKRVKDTQGIPLRKLEKFAGRAGVDMGVIPEMREDEERIQIDHAPLLSPVGDHPGHSFIERTVEDSQDDAMAIRLISGGAFPEREHGEEDPASPNSGPLHESKLLKGFSKGPVPADGFSAKDVVWSDASQKSTRI